MSSLVSLSAGPRWARADAVWWSAAGTGERSPILLDGAPMNAASSVLPMVRFPPCSFKVSLLSVYRVFYFLAHGGHGGPIPVSTIPTKPLSLCVYVCVVCASLGPVSSLARLSVPIDTRRCAARAVTHSLSPGLLAPPGLVYQQRPQESQASLARQARQ